MAHGNDKDCEVCEEHKALEERIKIIDNIPNLLTFMNQTKGIGILAAIVLGIMLSALIGAWYNLKSEIEQKQKDHEIQMNKQQEKMSDQVEAIRRSVDNIRTDVAVIKGIAEYKNKPQATVIQ